MADDPMITPDERETTPFSPSPLPGYTLTFWEWLRARFGGVDVLAERQEQLVQLDRAIERYPDVPSNYVLRGELYLHAHQNWEAMADFKVALRLARGQFAESNWGVLSQALADRAARGLARARRHLEDE